LRLNERRVEFSEVALAGLAREIEDESSRDWAKASLKFYLRRDAEDQAYLSDAFDDIDIYIFPFNKWRVTFEVSGDCVFIWTFSRLTEFKDAQAQDT
jgi:hypothetical protein